MFTLGVLRNSPFLRVRQRLGVLGLQKDSATSASSVRKFSEQVQNTSATRRCVAASHRCGILSSSSCSQRRCFQFAARLCFMTVTAGLVGGLWLSPVARGPYTTAVLEPRYPVLPIGLFIQQNRHAR